VKLITGNLIIHQGAQLIIIDLSVNLAIDLLHSNLEITNTSLLRDRCIELMLTCLVRKLSFKFSNRIALGGYNVG
jgi:hypothetical protein